ncbi:unnamed protein product [Symbiodinium necroappetens]|uniref:Uncharacterized protein n=1 Tax=Symbiodinium necroappetens TaxID=1628268 RepID=A0A812JYI3_9DINO|nr:unnamed protein product [Symbiodinium necroappetens]
MIKVRIVIQTTLEQGRILEADALLKECAERSQFAKACFPMVAFGSQKQILIGIGCLFVTMVWGDDRLLVKGLKHVAGRFRSLGNQVMDGFKGQAVIEDRTVTDITLLRHRRTMKQLVAMDLCQFLNGLAKELMLQDLDEVFMRSSRDGDVVIRGNARLTFEVEQFYVTRPLPAAAAVTTAPVGHGEELEPGIFEPGLESLALAALKATGDEEPPSARHFLMSTARSKASEADKKDKKKKKETRTKSSKKDKGKKKKKKSSSDSSSSGPEDSTSVLESEDVDDSAALFGLSRRELQKGDDVYKLDDLPSKHLGFVVSHVSELVGAAEVYECGGELEPWIPFGFGWALLGQLSY